MEQKAKHRFNIVDVIVLVLILAVVGFASTPTDCAPCSGSLSLRLRVS